MLEVKEINSRFVIINQESGITLEFRGGPAIFDSQAVANALCEYVQSTKRNAAVTDEVKLLSQVCRRQNVKKLWAERKQRKLRTRELRHQHCHEIAAKHGISFDVETRMFVES